MNRQANHLGKDMNMPQPHEAIVIGAGYFEGMVSRLYALREISDLATFLMEHSKLHEPPNEQREKAVLQL